MKNIILSLALLCANPSFAQSIDIDEQLHTFATCAGRLSAVMEHQWMFDGPASEHTKRRRDTVLELVAATTHPARDSEILQWRIAAKVAQAALLTRATFNTDAYDAAWASARADRLTRECTGLLLS